MRGTRSISLFLSVALSALITISLILFDFSQRENGVKVFLLVAIVSYVIFYLFFRNLLYRDIEEILSLFGAIKYNRIENITINKNRFRLGIFRKLFAKIFKHFYLNQKKIDQLTKVAAFRKEFIADVSHELKTPIFAAQGFVHTLLDGAINDKSVRTKFLEKAAKSLDGLDALVHDLLTLSYIEIGETKMQFEYFDIRNLIVEVKEQFDGKAEKKGIELEIQKEEKPIVVYADWLRIEQVMNNLVSNAIKYSSEGDKVRISYEQDKESVTIKVVDTGEGIPEKNINRIFERFYRVDKSRSREKGGTGLGLAIVKHIVEGHNSIMEVESEEGKGSVFQFKLPKGKD